MMAMAHGRMTFSAFGDLPACKLVTCTTRCYSELLMCAACDLHDCPRINDCLKGLKLVCKSAHFHTLTMHRYFVGVLYYMHRSFENLKQYPCELFHRSLLLAYMTKDNKMTRRLAQATNHTE